VLLLVAKKDNLAAKKTNS